MKNLTSLSLDQILKTYDLPHRLLVYFSSQCAKDALSRIKDPDPRSVLAVDVAERFGNGEDFSQEYLHKVYDDAYAATATSAYYAAATSAAYAAAYAAADDASAAANAAYYASATSATTSHYKDLLLKLIDERLTSLEKLLILG